MAILSASELEAVVNQVVMTVEKVANERASAPALGAAIRDLQRIYQVARQPAKLKPLRDVMEKVTDLLTTEIPDDAAMRERLWDLGDYIDYRT